MKSYWRTRAAPLVAAVLHATSGQPEAAIRKALGAAFPLEWRGAHSRAAWAEEIRSQWHRQRRAPQKAESNLFEEEEA
jgi:hypothetical protein